MSVNVPHAVYDLIEEYRRFLRTSYRFLDERLRTQFEKHLAAGDVIVRGPYVTLARDFVRGKTIAELAAEGVISPGLCKARWPFGHEPLFLHQEQALRVGAAGRSLVVTTGTGSGKTEAFLLPILDGVLRRKREGVRGVQAVLLYPMNALANDQLERLRRLLNATGLGISFALYTGDSETAAQQLREPPADTEILSREKIRSQPPDVLLTNYKQLEFLLIRRQDRGLFTPALRYLVLDEIHSYRGALATEIACLIRRLKAHAGLEPGELVALGTSATVASRDEGPRALARFATALFGETVAEGDIVGEATAIPAEGRGEWVPAVPDLSDDDLAGLDVDSEEAVAGLTERLTGRACPPAGAFPERIAAALQGNRVCRLLERSLVEPKTLEEAAVFIQQELPERAERSVAEVRRELEAYLLVGSIGTEDHPPRFRPKLHVFFHGVYDVALCLNPDCRALVPQGGSECPRCGSVARPAALCRTCGQDFAKVRFETEEDTRTVGTGDFFSDERTGFLTHEIHELPDALGTDDEENDAGQPAGATRGRKRATAAGRLIPVGLCLSCGRVLDGPELCPGCNRRLVPMLLHRGKLNTCPACRDIYTRGDIVTPLRTGTASTVSVLSTHHLDHLEGEDRKLLVFADNRQDAAHQAGYTADKNRSLALRHAITRSAQDAGEQGVHLSELNEHLLDYYRNLGIVRRRLTRPERDRWLYALKYEAANEFTRYSRQRGSLENLGLVAVDYAFLDSVGESPAFRAAAEEAGLERPVALTLVRAILDVMRKKRAVALDFFQRYIDPNRVRRFRELEAEPYCVRFPERDRKPHAFALDRPDHIRKAGRLVGFIQENPKAGQLTAPQKLVARMVGDRAAAERFLRRLVPVLVDCEILIAVPDFPIPKKERVAGLVPLQIDPRVIRLHVPATGYRCNACQTWRPYDLPTCPAPKCAKGSLQPWKRDNENYYVRLYHDRPPRRLAVAEHSAQIPGEERARRETEFKAGRLDMLVCTPTLELGVDIGPLLTVVLRNAPPTPANYAQRVGRAGRRLRIGFVSTFCAGGAHDRHAFEEPSWFVAGRFDPPRVRLDNPKVVTRHLRSYLLECVEQQLPTLMGELLDDPLTPTRWLPERVAGLLDEVGDRREELIERMASLLEADRQEGRTGGYDRGEAAQLVDGFSGDLTGTFNRWYERVNQLNREFKEYSKVGSPRQDEKKASARKRAYREITRDPERAYVLNYLSTRGLLPAYQFPLDTFSLDPGLNDTPTLYRPAAIAIEEFAPGNFVYANGRKLRSIRVLFPGGPGSPAGLPGRSDAETSGRLRAFHFCRECDEAVEAPRNQCPRCAADLTAATELVFVDAFEAEESLRIGSEEESRQKQIHERRETLISGSTSDCCLYPYPLTPVEHLTRAQILITNWGRIDAKTSGGNRFWLCPDCGRHLPFDPHDPKTQDQVKAWQDGHQRFCGGQPVPLVLAYQFQTDCLLLTLPRSDDAETIGRSRFSPVAVTLAEALLAGAATVLELEQGELAAFVRRSPAQVPGDQIVFYETVPGGAGYLLEMAARLPAVAEAAQARLYGHDCVGACYLCLKHYRNQRWHPFFHKDRIRDLLMVLARQETVEPQQAEPGAALRAIERMLAERREEREALAPRYRRGEIEELLLSALASHPEVPPGDREFEVCDTQGRVLTVPDFAWEDVKLAVYCDGFAYHGNPDTLALDARKRNLLQSGGWVVLTYWGRTILRDAAACAAEIAAVYGDRRRRRKSSTK